MLSNKLTHFKKNFLKSSCIEISQTMETRKFLDTLSGTCYSLTDM